MKTPDQIRTEVAALRQRLASKVGIYLHPDLIQSVIEAKIASKVVDEIESIIGTYTIGELFTAAEMNSEIAQLDSAGSGEAN